MPGTERDAIWDAYGWRRSTAGAARRSLFYLAKHIGAIRLERHRLGNTDAVPTRYEQMRDVLHQAFEEAQSAAPTLFCAARSCLGLRTYRLVRAIVGAHLRRTEPELRSLAYRTGVL